ncbi:SLBB domain-containing protein [Photobacterium sagamiensis]|uniref:SLBB domain-containing protein n=1 Tax=Photobacterium sagamiensis TaxID=2910241 RepID=UPI003D0FA589
MFGFRYLAALTIAVVLGTSTSFAANPTPEQLAQFKRLPPAQQQALARQYGIDPAMLNNAGSRSSAQSVSDSEPTIEPRSVVAPKSRNEAQYETSSGKTIQPFGYDLFAGQPTSFTPLADLPVPNDYVIAAGDEIVIQLYGKDNATHRLVVGRDGAIQLPKLGPIAVAGFHFSELKESLDARIKQQIIGVDTAISLGTLRTMQVYVMGDAFQPGAYNVNALSTVTQAMIAAGGIKETGSLRKVQIKRNGRTVKQIDLYNLLLKGNGSEDIRLQAGDTVFIPAKGAEVVVEGEVTRPAIYELKGKETLNQVLAIAGGTTATTYLENVLIDRRNAKGIDVYAKNLNQASAGHFIIQNGDTIRLQAKSSTYRNAVSVRGDVVRQGAFQFRNGMKVSDLFGSLASSMNDNADLDYALLIRERNVQGDLEVFQFSLAKALQDKNSIDNYRLQPKDRVWVFSTADSDPVWALQQKKLYQQARSDKKALDKTRTITQNMGPQFDAQTGAEIQGIQTKSKIALDQLSQDETISTNPYSREIMLEPLIERLKMQSSNREPVQIVEIRGEVRYPGVYPLAKQVRLQDIVNAAGGYKETAYKTNIEISRVVERNGVAKIEHLKIPMPASASDYQANVALQSKDRINVFARPEWRGELNVEIQGEVQFPGLYTLQRGETIAELVSRAGGLTEFAYSAGTIYSRESLRRQEQERLKLLNASLRQEIASLTLRRQTSSAQYPTSPVDAMGIVDELENSEAVGRMVINMPDILADSGRVDVQLEDGDKLYIPPQRDVVSIMGEVQFSSNHIFEDKLTVEDYLERAGGVKKQADADRIYVIRANGSVMLPNNGYWFSRSNKPLAPGDTIVVPIDTDYLDGLSTLSTATQMLYQIGVAWSAVKD